MSDDSSSHPPGSSGLLKFWQELRRRKVIRVGSVYLVTGWLIIQIADTTFASFGIPEWAFRFVTLMVVLGFPVALIIAWAFELTPDGIKTSKTAAAEKGSAEALSNESTVLTTKRNWSAYALGALLPTLIFGALALYFYIELGTSNAEPDGSADGAITQSIAVMPLVNMSSHEENVFFAGGIHEDVLTNLSRIKNLQVKSRTSMLKYAASDLTLSEIGKELDVNYIVEGSVRRIGNHVRVTVQLINARNDLHVWANNFERELVDVFATQSELAREITNSIHLELQPETVEKLKGMPTTSVKAYDLYIKAESLEKTEGETEDSMVRRREMLEQAVVEDPDFVEAWAVLKRVYDLTSARLKLMGWYLQEGEDKAKVAEELQIKSQRALARAMALGPNNVETLLSRVVDHQWPKSFEEMQAQKAIFDRILDNHPQHAKTWYHLGWWRWRLTDHATSDLEPIIADAANAFEQALRLDPFNARIVRGALEWNRQRGRQEAVTRLSERLTQIIPETAEDRRLARVSWLFRSIQIRSEFLATADETLIEDYETGLKDAISRDEFSNPLNQYWEESTLNTFTNNTDRIIELSRLPIEAGASDFDSLVLNAINANSMGVFLIRGDLKQARLLAQGILEREEAARRGDVFGCPCTAGDLALAHAVLGNTDEARALIEELKSNTYAREFESELWRISARAHLDVETAVAYAFGELAGNPGWTGFDEVAAYHILSRPFLTHPKVQAYYVNEGKWIDYLAKRVPEYAGYKKTATK